jgi:hypothetical protein
MPVTWNSNVLGAVAELPSGASGTPVRERLHAQALDIARAESLGQAFLSYSVAALEEPSSGNHRAEILRAGGESFDAPRLVPEQGELTALAFGVCTLGPALEQRVSALFTERRASVALALDELGNRMLREGSYRLQKRLLLEAAKRGLCVSGELRPGDPGLALEAQHAVLRLAHAEKIGVTATRTLQLTPLKSVSVIYGVGRGLPPAWWSRCDECHSRGKCATLRGSLMTVA